MSLIREESLDAFPISQINRDISVLIVCNKTGGTIKADIKKKKNRVSTGTWQSFPVFAVTQI